MSRSHWSDRAYIGFPFACSPDPSWDKIAEALHELPNNVSAIMGELEMCGAIIRHREKVAGMRGPGLVRYYMNPRVATHLAWAERDRAQETAPPVLTVVDGGRQ